MPLLVITLTKPPPERPNSTEAPLVMTENSLIDSCETDSGARPSAPPTVPPKKALLKSTPSMVTLVLMPRWPEIARLPRSLSKRVCGVNRTRLRKSRDASGIFSICSVRIVVELEVLVTSMTAISAVTSMVSTIAETCIVKSIVGVEPRTRRTSARLEVAKPSSAARML